ncbi:MAG TPA: hypothetical protein VFN64_01465 [Burkholderiaceae bacterium]|nr:hypothetical protein [Burkholderiaceae bacterium]
MAICRFGRFLSCLLISVLALASAGAHAADPLPAWNDSPAKSRILGFVQAVTDQSGKDYVPPADRIAVFDNSDGDFEMLEWSTSGPGPRLGVIVHHDDGVREFAYDRASHIGRLERGLDEGPRRGWTITSMKRDWKTIYPQ